VTTVPMIAATISRLIVQAFSSVGDGGLRSMLRFYSSGSLVGKQFIPA
jgi:hypothetical protein